MFCSGICDPYDQAGACTPDELARKWLPRVYSGAASVVHGCAFERLPFSTVSGLGEAFIASAAPSALLFCVHVFEQGAAALRIQKERP